MKRFRFDVLTLLTCCTEGDAMRSCAYILTHTNQVIEEMLNIKVGIHMIWLLAWLYANNAIEREVVDEVIANAAAEDEPAVAELFEKIGTEEELLWLSCRERLIHHTDGLLMSNVVVEWVEETQSLEVRHAVEVYDGLAVMLTDGEFVLKSADDIGHLGELLKVLKLAKHVNCLLHHLIVVLRHGHICDAIVLVGIAVVLVLIYLDGCVIAQFVGAHHLYVALNGTHADTFANAFHVIEGIGTGIYEVF